ncbi:MAG: formate dehydrogenase accessory sulfurtransferase FdhD [Candidatus Eremiobacteraeota bacterium]|nr:formate dehydrogenase accessory sulfurtransferase FdhD [Candidatus Eremiobacteraeota bacterium]
MTGERRGRSVEVDAVALDGASAKSKHDAVVTEEPLEIRLVAGRSSRTLAVTMRTPGNDFELAAGFAFGEGVVRERDDIAGITYCLDPEIDAEQRYNIVNLELAAGSLPDLERLERHFVTSSACGVCGRSQIESLRDLGIAPIEDATTVSASLLYSLPDRMREAQRVFESTGGLHAAALFDASGKPLAVREDVGRHNAVDKLAGWGLTNGRLPFAETILMVSGRASYEILQKSAVARIPIVCSVSAPSSLAVDLAREFNITLAGFLRGERANIYSAVERIAQPSRSG